MRFLKGLVSQLKDDKKSVSVQIVAHRFKQLFIDHGVELSQIPRIFPNVTLDGSQLLFNIIHSALSEVAGLRISVMSFRHVKQRAILSRLGVETASNSFHLSMSPSSVLAGGFWSDLYGHD